jgi:hypothetical protein
MSFVIDKTVTDKAPKKTVVSQFTGNNSSLVGILCTADSISFPEPAILGKEPL